MILPYMILSPCIFTMRIATSYSTTAREWVNPVDYKHPHASMAQFAGLLTLSCDANRTYHAFGNRLQHSVHQHPW